MSNTVSEALPRSSSRPGRPRTRRRFIFWFILVALLMALFGYAMYYYEYGVKQPMIAGFMKKLAPPPAPVEAVAAKLESMPRILEGIGTLQAVRQVTISPEVAGRVTQIMFEPGQNVKAGDSLVQLYDAPDRADLANFAAQARLAEVNAGRAKQLAEHQFGSQQNVDQAQSILDQAHAGGSKTQAIISQKLIRAPFDGQLGLRQVNLGQYLNPGAAVVTLTDLDSLYVDFTLPEQAASEIKLGQTVQITSDAYNGRTFKGELATIEPQLDPTTRALKLEAKIANADHQLRPGMFAQARLLLAPEPNVITVPETAVNYTAYGDAVYVVAPDGNDAEGKPKYKAVQTYVHVGTRLDGRVVLKDGVKAGDLVASSGQLRLQNGAPVRLAESATLVKSAVPPRD